MGVSSRHGMAAVLVEVVVVVVNLVVMVNLGMSLVPELVGGLGLMVM